MARNRDFENMQEAMHEEGRLRTEVYMAELSTKPWFDLITKVEKIELACKDHKEFIDFCNSKDKWYKETVEYTDLGELLMLKGDIRKSINKSKYLQSASNDKRVQDFMTTVIDELESTETKVSQMFRDIKNDRKI